jgi:hypothetical protein
MRRKLLVILFLWIIGTASAQPCDSTITVNFASDFQRTCLDLCSGEVVNISVGPGRSVCNRPFIMFEQGCDGTCSPIPNPSQIVLDNSRWTFDAASGTFANSFVCPGTGCLTISTDGPLSPPCWLTFDPAYGVGTTQCCLESDGRIGVVLCVGPGLSESQRPVFSWVGHGQLEPYAEYYDAGFGTWSIDPFPGDPSGDVCFVLDRILPVELTSFQAIPTAAGIILSFATASENNNARFEIMRGISHNGDFFRIADLPSQGNSSAERHYTFTDSRVNAGQTYWYYLADVDLSGARTEHRELMTSASMTGLNLQPTEYSLSAYPNPFNPVTTITFSLRESGRVQLSIFDLNGRLIQTLADHSFDAGSHQLTFKARTLPSGLYVVRLTSGEFNATHKLMLLK